MTSLGSFISNSPYKSGVIDVPHPIDIGIPQQSVIVTDDGATAASATLSGVRGGAGSHMQGYLNLKIAGGTDTLRVPATGSVIDPVAHTLTLTFPTTSNLKPGTAEWDNKESKLVLEPICDDQREWCPTILGG